MSYQKLKNIKFNGHIVEFEEKSNNDTAPYRDGACEVPKFLHNVMGGIYQCNNKSINKIVFDCRDEIGKLCEIEDFWWNVYNVGIDYIDICTEEIRSLFYGACDDLINLN